MIRRLLYIVIAAVLLVGCDVIGENDRFIPVDVKVGERIVLLEEFTGFRCVNCPLAAEIAHELTDMYPDNIVVVAMHPKGSAWTKPAEGYVDLTSDIATVYFEAFGSPEAFPVGMINRTPYNGSVLQDRSNWMTCVNEQLVVAPELKLSLSAMVDADSRTIDLTATVTTDVEFNGKVNLQLLLVEDDIVGAQLMPNGKENSEYVHKHVLREAINGNWGQTIELPGVGDEVDVINSYVVPGQYELVNCTVVAYLYHEETKQVIQAYQVKL